MNKPANNGTKNEATYPEDIIANFEFTDLFDIDEIQLIQDSFCKATGVASIITKPDGTPITKPSNFCRLCNDIIRKTDIGLRNCIYSDSILGRSNPSGPITGKCYSGGLLDGGSSITVNGRHIANWLIGQVIDENDFEEQTMLDYSDKIGANRTQFKEALNEVKRMPKEMFESISNFLFIFANQMSELAARNMQMSEVLGRIKAEKKKRKETEELYFKLINVSPDGITLADEKLNIIFASARVIEMLGADKEDEIIGTKITDWVAEEYLPIAELNIASKFAGKNTPAISYLLKRIDGSVFFAEINSSPLYDDNGNSKGIISAVRNITERIDYEKKLEESERNLTEILKKSPLPIILLNNNDMIEFINEEFENIFGYSSNEMKTLDGLLSYFNTKEIITDCIHSGFDSSHYNNSDLKYNNEADFITKSGTIKTIQLNYTKIKNKKIIILNDITESKNAQKKILENFAMLSSIIESPSDMVIYSLDKNLNFTAFNSNYKKEIKILYGTDIQLGMNIEEVIINNDELARLKRNFSRVLENGEQYKLIEDFGKGGQKKYFESAYNPIFDNHDSISGVTVFINNITERVKVKSALRASEEKFKLAVNQVPGVIWTVDKNLVFTMSVGAGLNKLKLKSGQAIGMTLFEFFNNPDKDYKPIAMHIKALRGNSVGFDFMLGNIYYEVNLEPLKDENGEIIGILGIALDVSEKIKTEKEKRITEFRYSQMIGNIPVGIIVHSSDSDIQIANSAACEILGVPHENNDLRDLTGKYWNVCDANYSFIKPDQHPFNIAVKTGLPVKNITVGFIDDTSGKVKWALLNAFPVFNFENIPEQVIVVLLDINDKRNTEELLEKQRLQLFSIMEGMEEPVYVQDPGTYDILFANDAFRKVFGNPDSGKCYQVIYKDQEPCLFCSNKFLFNNKSHDNYIWEMFNIRNSRWYRCIDRVIEWSDNRKVRFEIAIDITDMKNARQELEETKALFTAALEQVPAGIIITDAAGSKIRIMNNAAGSILQADIKKLLSKDILDGLPWQTLTKDHEIIASEDLPVVKAARGDISESNQELIIRRIDGSDIWVLSNAAPVYNNNAEIIAGITIFNDISERVSQIKVKEELISNLEAKNIEMERFIYTVSHDLKSPLVTIKGFSGMIEQDIKDGNLARAIKDLGRISNAADKMQELLEGLLKISRIGRIEANNTTVNINEIVNEVIALLNIKINELHAAVVAESNLPLVNGDKIRIFEIFLNLIDNALKFAKPGINPIIEIGCDRSEPDCFYIRDNGIGIDPKYHEKVFNLFEKLDIKSNGTGVGLALVKRIIEVQGGAIHINSDGAGNGTTFRFSLPCSINNWEAQ